MQYLMMYAIGIVKSPIISLPIIMNPGEIIDRLVY
jgi:hypothetical protein